MAGSSEGTGFFGRMREKLAKSATRLAGDFTSLFRGRKIDAELLDDLEARLIGADVGVEATQAILENLRGSVAPPRTGRCRCADGRPARAAAHHRAALRGAAQSSTASAAPT